MSTTTEPHASTLATLSEVFGDGVFTTSLFRDNLRLFVPASRLIDLLTVLKDRCGFGLLAELGATDYLGYPGRTRSRFEVHYVLRNLETAERLVVKVGATTPIRCSPPPCPYGPVPTGWNARCSTCSASASAATPTCGES